MGLVLLGLAIVGFCVLCGLGNSVTNYNKKADGAVSGLVWGVVLAVVVVGVISLSIWLTSTGGARSLEATSQTASVYRESIVLLKEGIDTTPTQGVILDAANLKQVDAYSASIVAYRDLALWYNRRLQSHRYWENSFWFSWIWTDVSPDLRPLVAIAE
jgi:hypothetical protein